MTCICPLRKDKTETPLMNLAALGWKVTSMKFSLGLYSKQSGKAASRDLPSKTICGWFRCCRERRSFVKRAPLWSSWTMPSQAANGGSSGGAKATYLLKMYKEGHNATHVTAASRPMWRCRSGLATSTTQRTTTCAEKRPMKAMIGAPVMSSKDSGTHRQESGAPTTFSRDTCCVAGAPIRRKSTTCIPRNINQGMSSISGGRPANIFLHDKWKRRNSSRPPKISTVLCSASANHRRGDSNTEFSGPVITGKFFSTAASPSPCRTRM
mmetsp:Transcript_59746/g.142161  ORF Transcript_59746/g.142161 Transcript_59746/m.142161 type:complete len:267 (-) Transcript_59746:870-1670(-)